MDQIVVRDTTTAISATDLQQQILDSLNSRFLDFRDMSPAAISIYQEALQQHVQQIQALISPEPIFTMDMMESFFRDFVNASDATVKTYKKGIKNFLQWLYDRQITRPQQSDVKDWISGMQEQNLKPTTINLYLVAVRLFFQWLDDQGLYRNITLRIKQIKTDKTFHKKDNLTRSQAAAVLEGIDRSSEKGLRDYSFILLLLTTGLRLKEAVGADVGDLRSVGDQTVLFIRRKGRSEKTAEYVQIGAETEKALRSYISCRRAKSDDPLFASVSNRDRGCRISNRSASRIAKSSMISAGYDSDRLTAHSTRHTAAVLNMENGGSLQETQNLLGHTNINTTMIYAHTISRANNKSSQRIEGAILGS